MDYVPIMQVCQALQELLHHPTNFIQFKSSLTVLFWHQIVQSPDTLLHEKVYHVARERGQEESQADDNVDVLADPAHDVYFPALFAVLANLRYTVVNIDLKLREKMHLLLYM